MSQQADFNVKRFLTILDNAITELTYVTDGELFNPENEEKFETDLRECLGMTYEEIEIYKNKEKINNDLIIPITFLDELDHNEDYDEIDYIDEEDDDK